MTAEAEPLRVVVADDHPFFRSGLTRSLRANGLDVVAEAPNGEAAIAAVEATAPDVVVMDLNMPGVSGLEATRHLTTRAPATRVLVVSVSAQEADVIDALRAGARGYVLKDGPVQEVIAGIRAAASGQSHISPRLAMPLLRRLRDLSGVGLNLDGVRLAPREHQVLARLAEGGADHEIADALGISTSEVRGHASSILMRLQLDNRVQAR